ncbi:unnamed protein product [Urochloa decumbens]|uniref:RING-type E3 ubiquitin transferase n=1 Tax=Urochloa decumbens TaxID=240449 RepID=A0ABC9AIE9_9POAL
MGSAVSAVRNGAAATSVTLELDALDCTVCWQPLNPPIFQCAVGHLICPSCLDKLRNTKKCHFCSREGDYNRCYAMEKVLGSMQVPCSHAKYGCTLMISYCQRQDHEATCPHGLCFCPESSCGFSERSPAVLLDHFVAAHGCPSTKFRYGTHFYIDVVQGGEEKIHALSSEDEHLFLLNMAPEPSGCVVSVFCVRPDRDTDPKFSTWKNSCHTQSSEFQVPSTTLSDGIPRDSFMFNVPKFYLREDSKICVTIYKILA